MAALRTLTRTHCTRVLADFKPEGSNVAGLATKNMYLFCLPEVLVLHLKRFQYTGSIVKNHKVCVQAARSACVLHATPASKNRCPLNASRAQAECLQVVTYCHASVSVPKRVKYIINPPNFV